MGNGSTAPDIGPDKLAVADQVIVSAGNILRAAGFTREEIGSFFRQAADQLAPNDMPNDAAGEVPVAPSESSLARLKNDFIASESVQELMRMGTGASALPPIAEPDALKRHFDLAMQMIPQIAAAQEWLRAAAAKDGLVLAANQNEWFASNGEGESQAEGKVVFLDEFEAAYAHSLATVGAVVDALVDHDDERAFAFLLECLLENSVVITAEMKEAMARGVQSFSA